jgi:cysteine desulfurase
MYGPKGVGALYVRRRQPRLRLEPLLHGGGHEFGLRSGTLPVPLIVGFARALEICLEGLDAEAQRLAGLRDRLLERLEKGLDGVHVTGSRQHRLPGNLHVCFEGVEADRLLPELRGVALSTGSACASGSGEPSHVLAALGLPEAWLKAGLRMGLGRPNTEDDIERVADDLVEAVTRLRVASPGPSPAAKLRPRF